MLHLHTCHGGFAGALKFLVLAFLWDVGSAPGMGEPLK